MRNWFQYAAMGLAAVAMGSVPLSALGQVRLQGAGATFPNPLYQKWVTEYQKSRPNVQIDYQSIGSGGGIKAITEKTVDFAGSDAPLGKAELEKAGGADNIVQVPSVAGGVVAAYNVPGIDKDLKLSGEILADIYLGKIANWNDARIAELNPDVKLPAMAITPAYRTDGSGTTYVFTNYLATQSDDYKSKVGMGKSVKWPIGQGGKGNEGVTAVVQQTPGAIGYIEQNYANANHIPFAAIRNQSGAFVKASPKSVSSAGEGAVEQLKGHVLKADLWNQAGAEAYPIASFTYLIVYKDLNSVKTAEQAQALVDFLWWATRDGQKLAAEMDYAPLADGVKAKVEEALKSLTYQGSAIRPAESR